MAFQLERLRRKMGLFPSSSAKNLDGRPGDNQGRKEPERLELPYNIAQQAKPSWVARAEVCAGLIARLADERDAIKIADFGCGDRKLEGLLKAKQVNFQYTGFDIFPQDHSVRRFDLDRDSLDGSFDVASLLGVLEYVGDIERALKEVSARSRYVVLTYLAADLVGMSRQEQIAKGWPNLIALSALRAILARLGLTTEAEVFVDRGRQIVLLCRSKGLAPRNPSAD